MPEEYAVVLREPMGSEADVGVFGHEGVNGTVGRVPGGTPMVVVGHTTNDAGPSVLLRFAHPGPSHGDRHITVPVADMATLFDGYVPEGI